MKKKWFWFFLSLVILVIDQGSKYLADNYLTAYQPKPLLPVFNLTLVYNTGAAFSFLSGAGSWHRWFFAGFSLIMSVILSIWLLRLPPLKDKLHACALSFILGGALGNLVDRLFFGYVTDFFELYYKNYHFPVFNVADLAITIGAGLLLLDLCKNTSRYRA